MLIEKEKIRRIIQDHKIPSFREKDEDELVNIIYEAFTESGKEQEDKLATKEDIKMLMQMMDKRFEAVEKRFEAIDKRFEDLYRYMDKRFEAVNKRFEEMNKSMDKRFEDMNRSMDKRFDSVDKRFEDMNSRFKMMFIFMNVGFSIIILLTILFKFVQV